MARERAEGFSATRPESLFSNPDKDGYTRESASGQLGMDLAKGHEIGLTFLHSRLEGEYDVGPSTENDRSISQVGAYSIYSRNQLLPNWTSLLRLSSGLDKAKDISGFGTDTAKTRQDAFSWQNDITIGSDLAQVLLERRIEHVESSSFNADSRTTNSIAASYQMRRGAHLASASVRNDDSSQYGSKTTGNLGYGYRITDALRVNASAGTSFRAPTYNELYFPGYGLPTNRPEQGRNAEAGVYYEKGSDRFSAVYYRNRVTDLIDYAPKCPGAPAGADVSCAYNINKALLTGLTLGASTRFGPYTLRGSLDFQNPRDETTGQLLVRRARRHGTLALEYAAGALAGGIETRFTSRRADFDDLGNPTTLGGYALLEPVCQLSGQPRLVGVWPRNNMLDKEHALASGMPPPALMCSFGVALPRMMACSLHGPAPAAVAGRPRRRPARPRRPARRCYIRMSAIRTALTSDDAGQAIACPTPARIRRRPSPAGSFRRRRCPAARHAAQQQGKAGRAYPGQAVPLAHMVP